MKKLISVEKINKMSYTDFIGLVNQWNVPPGAYATLNKWNIFSKLNSTSRLLEMACTTGFTSRELTLMSGCKTIAIDISAPSIKAAIINQKEYARSSNITYHHIDGYEFKPEYHFTHVVVGSALRLLSNPTRMLKKCLTFLEDEGYLLACEFWVKKDIPTSLIKKAEAVFNFTPTTVGYKDVMSIYEGLDMLYEERNNIYQETESELKHYTKSTIDRAIKKMSNITEEVYKTMFNRLYLIKLMSNQLRPYQKYNVLVLRYKHSTYPNRYVELF